MDSIDMEKRSTQYPGLVADGGGSYPYLYQSIFGKKTEIGYKPKENRIAQSLGGLYLDIVCCIQIFNLISLCYPITSSERN